jgi:uncharacterized protein (TIGR02391 family)
VVGGRETDLDRLRELARDLERDVNKLVDLTGRLALYERPQAEVPSATTASIPRAVGTPDASIAAGVLRNMTKDPYNQPRPSEVAQQWAAMNMHFLEVIFERFDTDAAWPRLDELQRRLDRIDDKTDLLEMARHLPKELGILDLSTPRVSLKVRALNVLPSAKPLLAVFIQVVQLAVQRYLADDGMPRIRADDLRDRFELDADTQRKVGLLLDGEPLILGGGTGNLTDPTWERDLARSIRELRAVDSVEAYLEAQARVLDAPPAYAPPIPRRVLVTTSPVETPQPADRPPTTSASTLASVSSPLVLRLDDLHPIIREACTSRFLSKHYADGVQRAATALRDYVRKRSGLRNLDGVDLMSQAFSAKDPVLVVANLDSRTGQSVQLGTMQLAQGAMAALRNPPAHERLDLDPAEAMTMVATLSLIARRVEGAKRARSPRVKPAP